MAMNEFEAEISTLQDIPRILSETLQLENYIFNTELPKPENYGSNSKPTVLAEATNDLNLSF